MSYFKDVNIQVGHADVANGNPVPVSDAGGSLTIDGTVAVSSGSVDVTSNLTIGDILDGAGDSVMDQANDAIQVSIVAGGGPGGTAMVDDAAFTPGSTSITPAGAMFDDASPDSVDEGDAGVVRMSANRNLYTTIRDAAGNERGLNVDASGNIGVTDAGGSLTIDGTVAVSSGSIAVTNTITETNSAAIKTAVEIIDNAISGNEMQVDIVSDGAGLATSAKQLADGHNVTVDNAGGGSAVNIQDGGNTITVDGTIAVSSGSVDVTNAVTVTATDLDIRHLNKGDDEVLIWANTAKDGSGTDYVPLVDSDAHLQVDVLSGTTTISSGSIAVTNTVAVTESSPISGFATSAKQLADGHNVTVDNISTNEVFVRGSQAAGSPADNEVVTVQGIASMTPLAVTESSPISGFATSAKQLADGHNVTVDNAAGGAAVNIQDGGNTITVDGTITVSSGSIDVTNTVTIQDGGNTITVDGTVAATQSGNWDINDISKGTQTNDVKVTLDSEDITIAPPTDFEGAPVTVGTSAVEITFSGTPQAVSLQSDPDNTGKVWLGKSNITDAGANAVKELSPGQSVDLDYNDTTNALYVVSDTATQNVFKLALL